ncbi:unnamed protein product [Paramecium sonneborni]|uniref:Mitogen-activated protein kinase n=1 Tax=Paramecium sonneborni TaxID=65129 RepID=A0A8S1L1H1_9CILI|nr:unnamed protein product [Paramecium sonneborni]
MSEIIDPSILQKYEILTKIGKGAYGIVWKAKDNKSQKIVALKKVFDAFTNSTDAQRTYREVCLLKQLNHANIIQLIDTYPAENQNDLYMVFEYIETDLHVAIRAKILQPLHRKYIIYQIFKALKYIHSSGMIHRDLKPANILLNSECQIKLADFGLARMLSTLEDDILTDYVATRWFRAPEILLRSKSYSTGVDMWAMGCMMCEMILGKAIFQGNSTINQIEKIIEVLGLPSQDDLQSLGGQKQLFDKFSKNYKFNLKANLNCSIDEYDLISQLLNYDPDKRLSASEALNHPYFEEHHNIEEEIIFKGKIHLELNDDKLFPIHLYRDLLYKQNNHFNKMLNLISKQKKLIQNIDKKQVESLKKISSQQQLQNQQFARSAFIQNKTIINQDKSTNKTLATPHQNIYQKQQQNFISLKQSQLQQKLKQICLSSLDKNENTFQSKSPENTIQIKTPENTFLSKSPKSKILLPQRQFIKTNLKPIKFNNIISTSLSPQSQCKIQGINSLSQMKC